MLISCICFLLTGLSSLAASYLNPVKSFVPQMPKLLKSLFPVRDEKKGRQPSPLAQQVNMGYEKLQRIIKRKMGEEGCLLIRMDILSHFCPAKQDSKWLTKETFKNEQQAQNHNKIKHRNSSQEVGLSG